MKQTDTRKFSIYPGLCLPLFALCLFFASCQQSHLPSAATGADDSLLDVASVELAGDAATRALIDGTETHVDGSAGTSGKISAIGLYAVCADGAEYLPAYGRNTATFYKQVSGKWQHAAGVSGDGSLRLSASPAVNVYAWHPCTLQPTYENGAYIYISGIEILANDDFTAGSQTDYLYACGSETSGGTTKVSVTSQHNPGLYFTLKHALAKLTFRVKTTSAIQNGALTLTKVVLKSPDNDILTGSGSANRRMSLIDGVLNGLAETEKLTYTGTLALSQSGEDVVALVAPASVKRFNFEFWVKPTADTDDSNLRKCQTKTLSSAVSWLAGKNYVYTVLVDGMSASLEGVPAVYEWTEEINDIPIQ